MTMDAVLSVQRALQESQKENSDLHYKVKQIEEEKLQLEEKCRQLEARNKDLEGKQQRQPDIKMINEGWGMKFAQGRKKFFSRFLSSGQSAELKETSAQLQGKKATIEEIQWDLQNMEQKNQVLQGKLNEAEKTIEKIRQQEEEKRILQDLERRNLELRELCNEMKDKKSELEREKEIQMQHKLKAMREMYVDLTVRFDETECKNKELLEEKKQQEEEKRILRKFERRHLKLQEFCNEMKDKTPELEREKETPMEHKLKAMREMYVDLKVRFDETECKNKELLEEKKQQEEEKRILQDFEKRNLELREFCNEMKDKTPELEREKEILEKQCSEMQCTIDGIRKKHSELMNVMLLRVTDLRSQITEMEAQKQQQEKKWEHLLRMHEEFKRKIDLKEEMYNKKQERNTDMRKANRMEKATYKDPKEKPRKEQAGLKEMEQRCKQLEKQNAETNDQLRTLILEKKALMEKYLETKKRGFCWLFR
uniref:golgin subfamily A member 6-like protein 6 n=1 Tax=Maylandia zebra TaxID=106582 RepID=UPI000D3174BB|nr:golgin subfamily A member 6-like protein 6 [Maylandia zebra]